MSAETSTVHTDASGHGEHETMTKGRIWKVFFILLLITCVEFFIALVVAPKLGISSTIVNPIYIVLTLLKAYFIVAFFMHLKFEKVGLALAIIVPILFIIGLILVLTNESHYWIGLRM
ncbi:cytochrome c oxidase subunit IV [Mucilaginibacter frigoritolerans]|uniref:Cytochrome c oxidase subunit IV n=1 Tax=Mucilaginibacter frigoritolerans TaxID=652788 RepID=A0A562U2K1_9SPHI|nr:cytochrome C oxidase subunit IV family protein [Mucilaginibacter frigoritolerans]TWJ00076.1 cytochrome c oxidase subunit IV [Mucilaginibacter frigoritolerans]